MFRPENFTTAPTGTVGVSPMISAVGRVFVRHESNLASGGKVSDIEIAAFLSRGGQGPEKQELVRLIGTLVEERKLSDT